MDIVLQMKTVSTLKRNKILYQKYYIKKTLPMDIPNITIDPVARDNSSIGRHNNCQFPLTNSVPNDVQQRLSTFEGFEQFKYHGTITVYQLRGKGGVGRSLHVQAYWKAGAAEVARHLRAAFHRLSPAWERRNEIFQWAKSGLAAALVAGD